MSDSAVSWTVAHVILQARILGWIAVPFSRGSSQSRDQTNVSCIAGRFFTAELPVRHLEIPDDLTYFSVLVQIAFALNKASIPQEEEVSSHNI